MAPVVVIFLVVAAVALIVGIGIAEKRRHDAKTTERHRSEASDARDLANANQLEADRQAAGAEERMARAKREQLSAEQQQLTAARHRSTAQDLQHRADEIDPDL
jgi:hypothetical protein